MVARIIDGDDEFKKTDVTNKSRCFRFGAMNDNNSHKDWTRKNMKGFRSHERI